MPRRHFFDLPVYRLPRDTYYQEREKFVDDAIYQTGQAIESKLREMEKKDPSCHSSARHRLQLSYGGCWEFNEIIGYIRLHFLGSQVRGEYFSVAKQRVVKTRTKTIEWRTWKLAPEVEVEQPYGDTEVLVAINQYVRDCRTALPNRFIDSESFERLVPYVQWGALFRGDT